MKKFLAVFDGFKMSKSTMEYAIQLANAANAHLVGVFLDEFIYRSFNVYKVITSYPNYQEVLEELDEQDKKKRDEAVLQFSKKCAEAKIDFSIHRDTNIAIVELKHESMFADLIIIDKHETFNKEKENPPSIFLRDLLGDVQCPVLVVSSNFRPIDKIVLLYDGGASALHAIKMFSYLLGNLQNLPVEIYTVKKLPREGTHLPDNKLMREFMKRHFPKAVYTVQKGNAEEQVTSYLRDHKENELVVMGAYQRGELSRWLKKSMADILIQDTDTPLFIAHNRM